ncbi:MAG: ThiF family adenylyltransferase [Candidatus Obscuribacterales bacterium]|nr:ThiF family adenylyltransferase [Candidatus Obscuribacterales bacterium]
MRKLSGKRMAICGVGALGSHLAMNLVKMGAQNLLLIDKDKVESRNLGTQMYGLEDVGRLKAETLRNSIFRDSYVEVSTFTKELNEKNVAKIVSDSELLIDVFDNSISRKLVQEYARSKSLDCLHAGVNEQYGEIIWNEKYTVPSEAGIDICDYPLSRALVLLVVATAVESLMQFFATGEKNNYSITLGDLKINKEE